MPLFKVVPHDRSRRVLVKGSTVTEVISSAKAKLTLPDGDYKIALEEDGTEIDDDEILSELAGTIKTPTSLIILLAGTSWQPPITGILNEGNNTNSKKDATPSSETSSTTCELQSVRPINLGASVWDKMPKRLIECCEKGERAYPVDRRAMVAIIASYMVEELKDTSRRTAERIAQFVTEKYPKSFEDNIGDDVIGAGMESLRCQLYNAVNYRKNDKLIKRKRCQIDPNDESDEENISFDPESRKSRKEDEYGCVDYQPLLPAAESKTTQEEKKKQLMERVQLAERDEEKIAQLIDETYPSQRIAINATKRNLGELFAEWPHFAESEYLKQHASRLLGKSVQDQWEKSLTENATPLRKFYSLTQKSKVLKARQKSIADETGTGTTVNSDEVLEILAKAKEASTASQDEISLISSIFPLTVLHMKEDRNLLYKVIGEEVEDGEILGHSEEPTPLLIIRGKSFFDGNAKFDVVIEQKVRVHARGLLDGILLTFLAYYVFGFTYPQKLCKTLEFIQRVMLQINPKGGTKRGGKKRKLVSYDPTVLKLANALAAFKEA